MLEQFNQHQLRLSEWRQHALKTAGVNVQQPSPTASATDTPVSSMTPDLEAHISAIELQQEQLNNFARMLNASIATLDNLLQDKSLEQSLTKAGPPAVSDRDSLKRLLDQTREVSSKIVHELQSITFESQQMDQKITEKYKKWNTQESSQTPHNTTETGISVAPAPGTTEQSDLMKGVVKNLEGSVQQLENDLKRQQKQEMGDEKEKGKLETGINRCISCIFRYLNLFSHQNR
jgi:hypothetical protein